MPYVRVRAMHPRQVSPTVGVESIGGSFEAEMSVELLLAFFACPVVENLILFQPKLAVEVEVAC